MKYIFSIIVLIIFSIGLFAQVKNDKVFPESEMILKTTSGDISGSLMIPDKLKSFPLVLIIAGSGATDRDCNSPMGIHTNAYKMLAQGLAENGIATLRFDKRGVGKSNGAMVKEDDLRFETYIDDVTQWMSLLDKDKRFSKMVLIGHSEGSLIGMIACENYDAGGFISLEGAGRSIDKILQEQLKSKLTPQLLTESNNIMDSLKAGKTVPNVNPLLNSLYRPSVQPYMISWIKFDPAAEIKKLRIPVMIIQGNADLQTSLDDAKLLSAAKPDAKLLIIDKMNHILKESNNDVNKNMATYNKPDLPLKAGLVDEIVKFVKGGK